MFWKCKVKGYFSVEAAMVFPLVVGTILSLIYLGFYQYDRCMLEFDVAMVALTGYSCDEQEWEMALDAMEKAALKIAKGRYIAWESGNINIEITGNRIRASGGGKLCFPFGFLIHKGVNGVWEAKRSYENRRINPVEFVRAYNKLAGGE